MAKQTVTTLVDDIDGSEAAHARQLGVDGVEYEIDLSEANNARLEDVLKEFIAAARKMPTARSGRGRATSAPTRAGRADSTAIRSWARENGHQVSDRGRVSRSVQEAFQQARERGEA